jgi:hypothetical protein
MHYLLVARRNNLEHTDGYLLIVDVLLCGVKNCELLKIIIYLVKNLLV